MKQTYTAPKSDDTQVFRVLFFIVEHVLFPKTHPLNAYWGTLLPYKARVYSNPLKTHNFFGKALTSFEK